MSVFEIGMLVCFGMAWPVSIAKSYRARTAAGKSPVFSVVVLVGYLSGIAHKVLYNPDFVIALYALNFIMVMIDLCLWFRNRRLDNMKAENL
jgi:lipopolysaccharide export LptBFGC system permease protein LptF